MFLLIVLNSCPLPPEQHVPNSGYSLSSPWGSQDMTSKADFEPNTGDQDHLSPAKYTQFTELWLTNRRLRYYPPRYWVCCYYSKSWQMHTLTCVTSFLSFAYCWILSTVVQHVGNRLFVTKFRIDIHLDFLCILGFKQNFKSLHCNLLLWIQALLNPQRPGN